MLLPEFLPPLAPAFSAPESVEVGLERFIEDRLAAGSNDLYAEAVRQLERHLLTRVLRQTGGNQVQAARLLGITRGSLRTKIRDLGITIARTVGEEAGE